MNPTPRPDPQIKIQPQVWISLAIFILTLIAAVVQAEARFVHQNQYSADLAAAERDRDRIRGEYTSHLNRIYSSLTRLEDKLDRRQMQSVRPSADVIIDDDGPPRKPPAKRP